LKILGVDPGYGLLGYGVIEKSGRNVTCVGYGAISTEKNLKLGERLKVIYKAFKEVLKQYEPDIAAVEKIYFVKSVTTALEVGHARGVILLALEQMEIPVVECSPQKVKIAVTGYGRAEKRQVQEMIRRLLGLKELPKPDDAADALAIAWCALSAGEGEAL